MEMPDITLVSESCPSRQSFVRTTKQLAAYRLTRLLTGSWLHRAHSQTALHKPRCAISLTSKLEPDSPLVKLLESCLPLAPGSRARLLEDSDELESAYREAALQGDSDVPENAEDEVDFHYTCFVKSHKDGHLYEMDGDRKGPVDWGSMEGEHDLLSERGLRLIRKFIDREGGQNMNFSLLALVLN